VLRESYAKGSDLNATVTEHFRFRDPHGGSVELQLQYRRGMPSRAMTQGTCARRLTRAFCRIYKVHELVDVVRSVPQNIDRVLSYQFRVTISEFSDFLTALSASSVSRSCRGMSGRSTVRHQVDWRSQTSDGWSRARATTVSADEQRARCALPFWHKPLPGM